MMTPFSQFPMTPSPEHSALHSSRPTELESRTSIGYARNFSPVNGIDEGNRSRFAFFALNRPSMLREIDRITVRIMNPVFGLAVGRSFVDAGRSVEFFARFSQPSYILHLETKMV